MIKPIIGLTLAFAFGFVCRVFNIPSPAPPVILGALLVMAMTVGYLAVDHVMTSPARHAVDCGGPSGLAHSQTPGSGNATSATRAMPIVYRLADNSTAWQMMRMIALLGLCAAYLQGGIDKLVDFPGAVAEVAHFGLPSPTILAIATIVTEFIGSALVLSGFQRWIGAIWLAGFTLIATFVANRFWQVPLPGRFMIENSFFEHLGLIGGFLLVALIDLREQLGATQRR
jgi:XapX domain-containing protein